MIGLDLKFQRRKHVQNTGFLGWSQKVVKNTKYTLFLKWGYKIIKFIEEPLFDHDWTRIYKIRWYTRAIEAMLVVDRKSGHRKLLGVARSSEIILIRALCAELQQDKRACILPAKKNRKTFRYFPVKLHTCKSFWYS